MRVSGDKLPISVQIQKMPLKPTLFLPAIAAMFLAFGSLSASAQIDAPEVVDLATNVPGRLGIDLSISDGISEYYLLDTGSSPFTTTWATNAPWWPGATNADTSSTNTSVDYGPGSGENRFYYYPATDSVSITGATGSVSATIAIDGEYAHYTNANGPSSSTADWVVDSNFPIAISNAVASNIPPNPVPNFFGILGSDLADSNAGLLSIIDSQTYGTNVVQGFILNGNTNGPTLTIAPTVSMVQSFTNTFQMNTNTNGSIRQNLISPAYSITLSNGTSTNIGNLPTLLDSGTPPSSELFITQGSNVDVSAFTTNLAGINVLDPGVSISMLIGDTPYTITSDSDHYITVYGSPTDAKSGGITYGLNFFENYNVLYDLQNQTVGIEAVPEPSTYVLLVLGGLALLIATRRKNA